MAEPVISEGVQLALIVAATGVSTGLLAPFIISWQSNRNLRTQKLADAAAKSAEKAEDYARQDLVAERLEKANREVAELAKATNTKLDNANRELTQVAKVANDKLDVIHVLVDGNITSALQSELDARRLSVLLMSEVLDLKQAATGKKPASEALHAVTAARFIITELEGKLAERQKAVKAAEQLAADQRMTAQRNAGAATNLGGADIPLPLPVIVVDEDGKPVKAAEKLAADQRMAPAKLPAGAATNLGGADIPLPLPVVVVDEEGTPVPVKK